MKMKGRQFDAVVKGVVLEYFDFPEIFTSEQLIEKVKERLIEVGADRHGYTLEEINGSIFRLNEVGFLDKVSPTKWRLNNNPSGSFNY
jgi:hypothetical protein